MALGQLHGLRRRGGGFRQCLSLQDEQAKLELWIEAVGDQAIDVGRAFFSFHFSALARIRRRAR